MAALFSLQNNPEGTKNTLRLSYTAYILLHGNHFFCFRSFVIFCFCLCTLTCPLFSGHIPGSFLGHDWDIKTKKGILDKEGKVSFSAKITLK